MDFTTDKNNIDALSEIISTIEKIRFLNPEGHQEFFNKEIRWTEESVQKTQDGIDIKTLELSFLDQTGLKVAADANVIAKLREWKVGGGLQKISRQAIKQSGAICLLRINENENNFIKRGELLQKIWLTTAIHQLAMHPVSAPLFFFDRIQTVNDLNADETNAIKNQKVAFEKIFPHKTGFSNLFLFRLSNADTPSAYSLRRDLKSCLTIVNYNV